MASSSVAAPAHILGHYRMEEAPRRDLVPLSDARYGRVTLRRSAAAAWRRMAAAAAADGVTLIPVSGFRSIAHQERLFFDVKAARGQTAAERALVSAPPGHSEHHTGYAVDVSTPSVGDDLVVSFDKTDASRWLRKNAAAFHFEMSFGKDNVMGVSYEPWHYRFVGDSHSLRTFAAPRAAAGK
ncbi:uncharacterized protein MICPUCDRAFT_18607 [Micromonas pusilla CCMP1545]|uniref:Predicted protein n=1 Tax=Micromonas pusilla (strain CCMP1545) TaxID=564608 RepID=C1MVR7_MICPC|nr:uncharacterized protein MICPUCDRAFT_18607 [Micromonas pusilla CCMP1545]EEH56040.1 predicted protein [Micromonas pusilla CCMP1545]|eukprot:XP_003060088.1 predicted protein [Micromonas pusilla CCMP1545]